MTGAYLSRDARGYVVSQGGWSLRTTNPFLATTYETKEAARCAIGHHRDMGGAGFSGTPVYAPTARTLYPESWR